MWFINIIEITVQPYKCNIIVSIFSFVQLWSSAGSRHYWVDSLANVLVMLWLTWNQNFTTESIQNVTERKMFVDNLATDQLALSCCSTYMVCLACLIVYETITAKLCHIHIWNSFILLLAWNTIWNSQYPNCQSNGSHENKTTTIICLM